MHGYRYATLASLIILLAFTLIPATAISDSGLPNYSYIKSITIYAPAVSGSGEGVLSKTTLIVAYPGSGRVFFSALPYTELDTQGAARIAAYIASLAAGVSFNNYDYYVITESNVPIIGGPSSGGLMCVGFLSLLMNKTLNPSVTMTGMINPDGTIGPVGGLKEKLDAAASNGFKTFLIPKGQRYYQYPVIQETRLPWGVIRRTTYQSIDLVEYGRSINVSVIEVGSIFDAFAYFTGVDINASSVLEPLQVSIPGEIVDSLLNNLSTMVQDTYSSASKVYDYYYKRTLQTVIDNLNNTLSSLYSIKDKYPVYTFVQGFSIYPTVIYYNLFSKVLSNTLSIDSILDTVNTTLISIGIRLNSIGRNLDLDELIWFSLAKAVYYRAGYYYTNALSSASNSNELAYLSYSLSYAEQCSILLDLMEASPSSPPSSSINLVDTRDLYAAASTIYSYIEALVNEVGGNTQVLSDASDYYGLMNSQVVNDTVTLLGFTIYVIGESTYALHMVFDQSNLDDVAYVQQAILTMLSSKIPSSPVLQFFIKYGSEALENRDYSSAIHGFSQAFSLYLVLALTLEGNSNTGSVYASTSSQGGVASSNTTTPSIQIPVNQPIANTTTPENQLSRRLILEYLGILVITAAAISVILALRMIKHR